MVIVLIETVWYVVIRKARRSGGVMGSYMKGAVKGKEMRNGR